MVLGFGAVVVGLGVLMWAVPAVVAKRFQLDQERVAAIRATLPAAVPALLAMGVAAWLMTSRWSQDRPHATALVVGILTIVGYVSLTTCLSDWMIDDAAITFAYSKNLAAGHGIVIHPGHAPEEGYSTTLWMLILAAGGWMGADIAVIAKRACVGFGALSVALSLFVCARLSGDRLRFGPLALGMSVCLGAPFIIWSVSGLEHSLQAALLAGVVAAPFFPRFQRLLLTGCLSALVLTRPEAPLTVALVGAVLILRDPTWLQAKAALRRHWPVVAVPAVVWLALMAFRAVYFHDTMSNPYYAKAVDASWFRLINFVGKGWGYLTGWLGNARTWLIVPLAMVAPLRRGPLSHQLAVAVCLGQVVFILFVNGDWMGSYRFIAPILPVLATVVVCCLIEAGRRWSRLSSTAGTLTMVWFLGVATIIQLVNFRAEPTTPTAIVGQIGKTFVELGHRLGIQDPSLAHHDAGGTSYEAGIDLIDLGGLGDREVAKHMHDRDFIRTYLFEQRRPTFIFGSSQVFAAKYTEFFRMPEFDQYVPLRFPGRPFMNAELCHVRRDAIHPVTGVRLVKDGTTETWIVD